MNEPPTLASNRGVLLQHLTDDRARALVELAAAATEAEEIARLVTEAAAERVAEVERSLADADARLA
jgi:hypothetical protein